MILQVSVIGIIAVGVTQVIITGGIDLSSGSVVGLTAMVAASLAQTVGLSRAPSIRRSPTCRSIVPVAGGPAASACSPGSINGALIAYTGIPPFIATLGMMVTARGVAKWYTRGQPVSMLSGRATPRSAPASWPVVIFLAVALIFHIALRYTRYGKFTYAIGANRAGGARLRHQCRPPPDQGLRHRRPAGRASPASCTSARAISGQAGMGVMYELDAIAATVIGGTSLSGGVGRITGTVIGTIILGVMTSGFTFLRVDAYYQEIVKGIIIVAAVVVDQYRQRQRKKA